MSIQSAEILITEECNSMCITCDMWKKKECDKIQFSLSQACELTRQLARNGVKNILFTGGDPICWKFGAEGFELLKKAAGYYKKVDFGAITSGMYSTAEQRETFIYMLNNFQRVNISIDGFGDTYRAIRNQNVSLGPEDVIEAIYMNKSLAKIKFSVTVSKINFPIIAKIWDMLQYECEKLKEYNKADARVGVYPVHSKPGLMLTGEQLYQLNFIIGEYYCGDTIKYYSNKSDEVEQVKNCIIKNNNIVFEPDLSYYPCCVIPNVQGERDRPDVKKFYLNSRELDDMGCEVKYRNFLKVINEGAVYEAIEQNKKFWEKGICTRCSDRYRKYNLEESEIEYETWL